MLRMLRADIAVVGAGPAGAATAIHLARSGHRVVVIDKATFPRDKTCGDGLTGNALRRLDALGLDPSLIKSWRSIHQVMIRVPDGRQTGFPFPDNGGQFVAAARRADLDAALLDVARADGVTVFEGAPVVDVQPARNETVQVTLAEGETVTADYVVAADGMWSPVRKMCGLAQPGYRGDAFALRQYFRGLGPAADDLWVWFEQNLLPGYAWSFPLGDGTANIGLGVVPGRGSATGAKLTQHWNKFIAQPHVRDVLGPDAHPDGPLRVWPIPSHIARAPLAAHDGRVLFVGDAARAADSLTYEGIGQGLETAELAARAIRAAGPRRPRQAAGAYRRAVLSGLAVDDWVGNRLSLHLARTRHPSRWMTIATATPQIQRHFPRMMFEDYPRALGITPHRWRRGLFRSPPAYPSDRSTSPAPATR
jgi:geranylgeranyl reductase family protein